MFDLNDFVYKIGNYPNKALVNEVHILKASAEGKKKISYFYFVIIFGSQ